MEVLEKNLIFNKAINKAKIKIGKMVFKKILKRIRIIHF
jgi:hypothetical protein